MADDKWRDQAKCKDNPDDALFFVDEHDSAWRDTEAAKAICRTCPAQTPCFAYAYASRIPYGVFGASTADERRLMWRRDDARKLREQRRERAA